MILGVTKVVTPLIFKSNLRKGILKHGKKVFNPNNIRSATPMWDHIHSSLQENKWNIA